MFPAACIGIPNRTQGVSAGECQHVGAMLSIQALSSRCPLRAACCLQQGWVRVSSDSRDKFGISWGQGTNSRAGNGLKVLHAACIVLGNLHDAPQGSLPASTAAVLDACRSDVRNQERRTAQSRGWDPILCVTPQVSLPCSLAQHMTSLVTALAAQASSCKTFGLPQGRRWLPSVICLHHGAPWWLTVCSCIACIQVADTENSVKQNEIIQKGC